MPDVVAIQLFDQPEPELDRPYEMRRAHPLGWPAVLLLTVDVVVARAWHHGRRDA